MRSDSRLETGIIAALGGCLSALAALITLSGSDSESDALQAFGRLLIVGIPFAVGIYARQREDTRRFGGLLVISGLLLFVVTFSEAQSSVLYSIGRTAGWCVDVWLVYAVLAFPTGRLPARADRVLVALAAGVALILFLPTVLVTEAFPLPNPWTSCIEGCPGNAFMLTADEPGWLTDGVRPVREILAGLVFVAVTLRLAQRLGRARRLVRVTLAPVLAVACVRMALYAAGLFTRRAAPDAEAVVVISWLIALTVPLLAGAFVLGLARRRMFDRLGMHRLATALRRSPSPQDLRRAIAGAFDDPRLEIVYRLTDRDGWTDADGAPVEPPPPGSDRCLTPIRDGDEVLAALIHDAALRGDTAFVDTATSYARMTLANHRLSAQAAFLIREVDASRARIQQSADEERRRIERDLHDGAQQRLVALRIQLELAAERLGTEPEAARLRELGTEVDTALDEMRSLARGIYPAPLADRGLIEALRSAALQSPLPATVLATGVDGRYAREVETAAYFCCLEALQNAAKHARGASAVVVEVRDERTRLRFEVRDDGAGFTSGFHGNGNGTGSGLTNIRDRLAAVGGELAIVSSPGHGARIVGTIPLHRRAAAGEPDGVASVPAQDP